VINEQKGKQDCQQVKSQRPGLGDGCGFRHLPGVALFEPAGEHYQYTLAENNRKTIKSIADTDEISLFFFI